MNIELRFTCDTIDWDEACSIFERAPLGTREPAKLSRTFRNSAVVCFAFDDGTMVGLARALSDGEMQTVVYDLCVLPEYQGKGLGKRILRAVMNKAGAPNVILFAVPGKEAFYAKSGFRVMNTAMGLFANPEEMARKGYIR